MRWIQCRYRVCQGNCGRLDLPAGSGNFDSTGSTPRSRYVVWRTIVPKKKNKTRLPRGRNDNRRREKESDTTRRRCSEDGERKEQERGTGREMDCGGWGWKDVKRLGKNGAGYRDEKRISRWSGDTVTRWKAGREGRFFLLHFPQRASRFKGEFNLCRFIIREHFAVYPWKPAPEIHPRARRWRAVTRNRPVFFVSRKRMALGKRWFACRA